jgi:23S rRNA (adenine2030-N6)-methyltransferase
LLSYRHSFHAGNHADVLKHTVQIAILNYLKKKDTPFDYHDTHAGAGFYALSSKEAQKTGEFENGIGRLYHQKLPVGLLRQYVDLVRQINPNDKLTLYPGSPQIAELLRRPQDGLQLTELHPTDFGLLKKRFSEPPRTRVAQMDAYQGLRAMLPPLAKRGLILLDPSYEVKTEYQTIAEGLVPALKRFSSGIYAIWYPVIERRHTEQFLQNLMLTVNKECLRVEFCPFSDGHGVGMTGSGMLIFNPPYTLAEEMKVVMPLLNKHLSMPGHRPRSLIRAIAG